MSLGGLLRSGEPRRFLIAGAVNTIATYLLYLALVRSLTYPIAYSASYLAGILLSFALNSRYVFRRPATWAAFFRYPLVYVVQYALGMAILWLCLTAGHLPQWMASGLAIAGSVPVTFFLARWALGVRTAETAPGTGYNSDSN